MKYSIEIETKTFVRFWLVIIGFVLVGFMIYKASAALAILGIALFLALALNEPVTQLAKRLPGRSRLIATALSYIAVVVLLGSVLTLVVPVLVQQTAKFAQSIPSVVENAGTQWGVLNDFIDRYGLQPQVDAALESVQKNSAAWAGDVGQNLVGGIGSAFTFIGELFLVLVLAFLMLIEGPKWLNRMWRVYTDNEMMQFHRRVLNKMYRTVTGYVSGQLTVSSIGAIAAGIAVFILSLVFGEIPSNLAIPVATLTFILSLIPMFGATIAGILAFLLLASNSLVAAIIYVVYFVVYQQIENNFIVPHIQSKRLELSALAVLIAVTLGFYLFGIIGGIISIPIAGSVRILFLEYLAMRKKNDTPAKPKKA